LREGALKLLPGRLCLCLRDEAFRWGERTVISEQPVGGKTTAGRPHTMKKQINAIIAAPSESDWHLSRNNAVGKGVTVWELLVL
jgi:hypothetical protein